MELNNPNQTKELKEYELLLMDIPVLTDQQKLPFNSSV